MTPNDKAERMTVAALLDALGIDRTDHDAAVRAACSRLLAARAEVERLRGLVETQRAWLSEIRYGCDDEGVRAKVDAALATLSTPPTPVDREGGET